MDHGSTVAVDGSHDDCRVTENFSVFNCNGRGVSPSADFVWQGCLCVLFAWDRPVGWVKFSLQPASCSSPNHNPSAGWCLVVCVLLLTGGL